MASAALVLTSHAVALAAWVLFVRWEVCENARLIKENGSADDLKVGFHSRRTWIRILWGIGCCVGGSLAAGWPDFSPSFGALVCLLGGYFVRTFNPQLNVALGLAYKARFYLSPSPTAASFPDKWLWARLRADITNPTQGQANLANQLFLNTAFIFSLVFYAILVSEALFEWVLPVGIALLKWLQ